MGGEIGREDKDWVFMRMRSRWGVIFGHADEKKTSDKTTGIYPKWL